MSAASPGKSSAPTSSHDEKRPRTESVAVNVRDPRRIPLAAAGRRRAVQLLHVAVAQGVPLHRPHSPPHTQHSSSPPPSAASSATRRTLVTVHGERRQGAPRRAPASSAPSPSVSVVSCANAIERNADTRASRLVSPTDESTPQEEKYLIRVKHPPASKTDILALIRDMKRGEGLGLEVVSFCSETVRGAMISGTPLAQVEVGGVRRKSRRGRLSLSPGTARGAGWQAAPSVSVRL